MHQPGVVDSTDTTRSYISVVNLAVFVTTGLVQETKFPRVNILVVPYM